MKNDENKIRKNAFMKYNNIEEEFFEIDKEKKLAKISLSFDRVSEIFDLNYISKMPVLSDDFMEWITSAFSIIPSRYKIQVSISFGDYEGYSEQQLNDIFWKNIVLSAKSKRDSQRKRNSIAYGLIAAGIVLFAGMILT